MMLSPLNTARAARITGGFCPYKELLPAKP